MPEAIAEPQHRAPDDAALEDRMDLVINTLATVTDQITALAAQTSALRDLVLDRVTPPATGAAAAGPSSGLTAKAHRDIQDQATMEIVEAVAESGRATGRVEQMASALSFELADVAQSVSDQLSRNAEEANGALTGGLDQVSREIEGLNESVSASLTQIADQLSASADASAEHDEGQAIGLHVEHLVEGTSDAVARIETLAEMLIETAEERPVDLSEHTTRTLERLGLTVGARMEASATTAAQAIDEAVTEAIDRAIKEFKETAPPPVDRSTTSAITRLEERIAELTRQQDTTDRQNKATLNSLEETVGRLASAQAEDLERILDTIDGVSTTMGSASDRTDSDLLERVEAAIASITAVGARPGSTDDMTESITAQLQAVRRQMDAIRRRLPVRARTASATPALDERTVRQLADLVAEHLRTVATARGTAERPSRPARAARPARPTRAKEATVSRNRRKPSD
ncbi:MAG: hypothetical protein M3063_04005 [Actinomycetota bacterium]|nr:hypothetical protein [Actinomycetota bacterium]